MDIAMTVLAILAVLEGIKSNAFNVTFLGIKLLLIINIYSLKCSGVDKNECTECVTSRILENN